MKFFSHAEGYVDAQNGNKYVSLYKDHLGNVRLSYVNIGTTGSPNLEIQEENNYYPFGLEHKGYNNVVSFFGDHPYKYNGKELNEELGLDWYDFGARNYDAALGRWMNLDPHAGKYLSFSPYNYALNNPLLFVDPDGRELIIAGNRREQRQIFRELKTLINDKKLKLDRKTGLVTLSREGARNRGKDLKTGIGIVSDIFGSKNKVEVGTVERFKATNQKTNLGKSMDVDNLEGNQTITFTSEENLTNATGENASIIFDPNDKGEDIINEDGTTGRPLRIGLAHELIHANNIISGNVDNGVPNKDIQDPDTGLEGVLSPEEINVRLIENDVREEQGVTPRKGPIDNTLKNTIDFIKKVNKNNENH